MAMETIFSLNNTADIFCYAYTLLYKHKKRQFTKICVSLQGSETSTLAIKSLGTHLTKQKTKQNLKKQNDSKKVAKL